MIRMTALKALMLLCLALGMTVSIEQRRIDEDHVRAAHAALAFTNLAAERDSTRNVAITNSRLAALIGDSLRVVEKHAIQVTQQQDALDRALTGERRARYALDATVDSLHRAITVPASVRSDDGVRLATFDLCQEPYTIEAAVTLPPPPDSARITLRIAIDPIPIEARLSCASPNADGIRTASVTASSPSWAAVRFGHVEQSPEVCASPALTRERPARRSFRFAPLVLGAGFHLATNGSPAFGLFIGSGVRLGN
ncbi:MAG: hypothetical protein JWM41_715 [Gemmatimonadetes bacterium]|nr:hypothetical protein [Gemmatimonadota bacterium]